MPHCPDCGGWVEEGRGHCPQCGYDLSTVAPPPTRWTATQSPEAYVLRVGDYVKIGWHLFKQYPWGFIGFTALTMIISVALNFIPVVGGLVNFAINLPLHMGAFLVASLLLQRQTPQFKDFFAGFHFFLPLLLLALMMSLILVIVIIPFAAILVAFWSGSPAPLKIWLVILVVSFALALLAVSMLYLFSPFVVVDRRLKTWPAMELSRKTVQKNFFGVFGFLVVLFLMALGGLLALGVGILVAIPWIECALAAAYADIFGLQSSSY